MDRRQRSRSTEQYAGAPVETSGSATGEASEAVGMNHPAEEPPSFSVRRRWATIGTRGTLVTDDRELTWLQLQRGELVAVPYAQDPDGARSAPCAATWI
jgi:hypothetical protein